MYLGTFSPISNRARWSVTIQVTDENDVAVDISSATIVVEIRSQQNQSTVLSASTDNGKVTLASDGIFTWLFTEADMRDVDPGTYDIGGTVELVADEADQLFIGTVAVLDGVVR